MRRNTNNSGNNLIPNQLKLLMPRNKEFYEQPIPIPAKQKLFKAIKCDAGGWFIYSCDISYIDIGMKAREIQIPSVVVDCNVDNYKVLQQDGRFELTTPTLISTKIVMGGTPVDVIHNKTFIGLDWVDSDGFVVFLRYTE